ncbi:MAG TPA: hypothetical protein VN917_02130 [Xanthobacteraceae bacterium]|nr:hypothetical protein [Xanthobacteraceae bacterium]
MERSVGATAFGAVWVAGGGLNVRMPRLPKLDPPPARAFASAATKASAASSAANISNERAQRAIEFLLQVRQRIYRYSRVLW